jgi:hypothetical protein
VRLRSHDTDNFVFQCDKDYSVGMSRGSLFLVLALTLMTSLALFGQDDGPPISITSPDKGDTFSYGSIQNRSLYWNKNEKVLVVRVTFIDAAANISQANEDAHEFRLPGVSFDEAKGVFTATTAKGEVIPVAHFKKVLFIKSIETTPNAVVRIIHPHGGNVTVILEAISPNDPAMHPAATDPDGTHKVDIDKILN